MGEGGEAGLLQEGVELGYAVLPQEEHRRHVQRPGQCLSRRDGAIELTVKVLRGKAAQVHRNVGQQRPGKNHPFLQRRRIEQRLQDASRTPCRCRYVHLFPRPIPPRRGISHIGHYGAAAVVDHQGGHVGHAFAGQVVGAQVHGRFHRFLQRQADVRSRALSTGTVFYIVGRPGGKGERRFGQFFGQGRFVGVGIYISVLQESFQQAVAFFQQLLAVASGVHGSRCVGQDGQGSGLSPGQFGSRPAEVAPCRRFQSHHIAAKGRVGGI